MSPSRSLQWIVWGGLAVTGAAIFSLFLFQRGARQKNQGPAIPGLVRSGAALPVYFQIPDFALTNQAGEPVGLSRLRGSVWLADVIFTRCAGPCPRMTQQMADLQRQLSSEAAVRFVTLTSDPDYDTPAVLEKYARRFGANPGRWHFLTGPKQPVRELAVKGLKLTVLDKELAQQTDPNDLFIHSTTFLLMDRRGQVRAVFDSDDADFKPKVSEAVRRLLKEKENASL